MSLPLYYVGVDGDRCRCGRRESVVHCLSCGSFKVKVIKDSRLKPPNARDLVYWLCNKCDFGFADNTRTDCNAPVYETKVHRVAHEIKRTREAQANGHPLTAKEEVIATGVDNITVEQLFPDEPKKQLEALGFVKLMKLGTRQAMDAAVNLALMRGLSIDDMTIIKKAFNV